MRSSTTSPSSTSRIGSLDQARKVYLGLISDWPQSRYIPNAYLAFGELFFTEAQTDPTHWELAEQSYKKVAQYPAPENKVLGYAHYKLAYVYWNKGDYLQALSEFKKTIDFGAQFPELAASKGLAASARRDLLPVYALAGDPKKAYDFLKPLSGDVGADSKGTFKLMGELGQAYLDTGHFRRVSISTAISPGATAAPVSAATRRGSLRP